MSYILEALKKSEAKRQTTQPTTQPAPPPQPGPQPEPAPAPAFEDDHDHPLPPPPLHTPLPVATTMDEGMRAGWVIFGMLALASVALAAIYWLRAEPEVAATSKPVAENAEPMKPEPVSEPKAAQEPEPTPKPEPAPAPNIAAVPEPPAPPVSPTKDAIKTKPVTAPELTIVDELPPEAKAQLDKTRELGVATPRNHVGELPKRSTSKPVVITAPRTDPKKATKAQKAKADAQKALRQINVAWSSIDRGHYAQAVRDLDTALKLVPNSAEAWFARGWANEKAGKELTAIGDYARAIKSKPDHEFALFSRGYLNLYVGNPQDASADFARASGVTKDRSFRLYTQLWLHFSRTRINKDGGGTFNTDLEDENLNTWPGQLVRHIQGKLSEDEVLTAIERGTDAQVREQRCTGFFFLGVEALGRDDRQTARSYFERALATGAVQFRQYDAAKRELERLKL